jgi:hypothetical protein
MFRGLRHRNGLRLLGGSRGRAAEAGDGEKHREQEALFHNH